jgi:hypothetical protein
MINAFVSFSFTCVYKILSPFLVLTEEYFYINSPVTIPKQTRILYIRVEKGVKDRSMRSQLSEA